MPSIIMGIIRVRCGGYQEDLVVIFSHGEWNWLHVQCGFSWLVSHSAQISAFTVKKSLFLGPTCGCRTKPLWSCSLRHQLTVLNQKCLLSVATKECVFNSVEFNLSEEPVVACADFFQKFIDCIIPPRL